MIESGPQGQAAGTGGPGPSPTADVQKPLEKLGWKRHCCHVGVTPMHSPTGSISNSSFQSIKSVSNSTVSGERAAPPCAQGWGRGMCLTGPGPKSPSWSSAGQPLGEYLCQAPWTWGLWG